MRAALGVVANRFSVELEGTGMWVFEWFGVVSALAGLLLVWGLPLHRLGMTPLVLARATQICLAWMLVQVAGLTVGLVSGMSRPGGVLEGFGGSLYIDSLTLVMAALISTLGIVVARFAIRYLDGQPRQAYFFRWFAFTLAAVLSLVLVGDLLSLTLAWIATSTGLHQLLTFHPDRREAVIAARTKFVISRLGDAFLILGLVLTYREFGSWRYDQVFAAVEGVQAAGRSQALVWIAVAYVLGAMTKSAQFPFHSWLPNTMETPTPVSALMHAGVINAGGFLIIRLSPLVAQSTLALDLLALIGAFTALFGALVASTQTSVKRSLAFSTVAQMGFMMLQCGLGAFSAALLHIVAHSAYKAHAFLSSGSVLEAAQSRRVNWRGSERWGHVLVANLAALVIASVMLSIVGYSFGILGTDKPGAIVLSLVMLLALTQLIGSSLTRRSPALVVRTLLASCGIVIAYAMSFRVFDLLLAQSVSHSAKSLSPWDALLVGSVMIGFAAMTLLSIRVKSGHSSQWLARLHTHAAAGFYIDVFWRRFIKRLGALPSAL
ncbi:MAG: proton-conducting transporter membrane subunit [Pirellulaceae bacterium]